MRLPDRLLLHAAHLRGAAMIPDLAIKRWQHGFRGARKDSVRAMGDALRRHHARLRREQDCAGWEPRETEPGDQP